MPFIRAFCAFTLLTLAISAGCTPAAQQPTMASSSTSPLAPVMLGPIPTDTPLIVQLGQQIVLPARSPATQWQLDYDSSFWRPQEQDGRITLQALRTGETTLVQRERPRASGAPAARQFRYSIVISAQR